jgi:hypothetical protein
MDTTIDSPLTSHQRAYLYMALAVLGGVGHVAGPRRGARWTPGERWIHQGSVGERRLVRQWWGFPLSSSAPAWVKAESDHITHCSAILALVAPAIECSPEGPAQLVRALDILGAEDSLARRGFEWRWCRDFPGVVPPRTGADLKDLWHVAISAKDRCAISRA